MRSARLLCFVFAFALAAALPFAQQPTFRATVRTVAVYATVTDSTGRLVPDLSQSAFEILEDGRPGAITVFSREQQPLSVAIMLDTSVSMAGWWNADLPNSVLAFLDGLNPADRASIGTFGLEIAVGANLTNDKAELRRVLDEEVWKGGGTPLWQALRAAMSSLSREPGRRVVLALTDGHDSGGLPGFPGGQAGAAQQALEDDCIVYAVGFKTVRSMSGSVGDLARATGGGHFEVPQGGELRSTFRHLAEELRHQYLIGFVPRAADGKPHTLQIRMKTPGLSAKTRGSFVAPEVR